MRALNHPATGLVSRLLAFGLGLFPALLDMRDIASLGYCLQSADAFIPSIRTKVLLTTGTLFGFVDHDGVKRGFQQPHIVEICPAGDER